MHLYEIEFSKNRGCDDPEFKKKFFFVDVRETWERNQSFLPMGLHIPLGDLEDRRNELPGDKVIVLVCEHGVRSLKGALLLNSHAIAALSLKGGLCAYDVQQGTPLEEE